MYTRYSKEPVTPTRTIRKRSYKNFVEADYVREIMMLDFTDVYLCKEVNDAALVLTAKIVDVLNKHAPWTIYQERRKYTPWITPETLKLMKDRDELKQQASVSNSLELWNKFKKVRNRISNKIKQEESAYMKKKLQQYSDDPSKTWSLAKKIWIGILLAPQLSLKYFEMGN